MLHQDYLEQTLLLCREHGIHTLLQTSGFFNLAEAEEKVLPNIDLIMYDLKVINPQKHADYTGRENTVIIENLRTLARTRAKQIIPRMPLIAGFTDSPENINAVKHLCEELRLSQPVLLKQNPFYHVPQYS